MMLNVFAEAVRISFEASVATLIYFFGDGEGGGGAF